MNSSLVDKIKILEDEIRRYRVLIEAISQPKSNEHDNEGKHASLVRYIMEMVYRDFKREFTDSLDSNSSLALVKKVLLSSSEKLLQKFPNVIVVSDNAKPENSCLRNQILRRPPCLQISSGNPIHTVSSRIVSVGIEERKSSGLFSKNYVIYSIRTTIYPVIEQAPSTLSQTKSDSYHERRFSDFVTLYENLKKNFPLYILPPLPPKTSMSSNDKATHQIRRRQLRLWLQYLLLHPLLSTTPQLKRFLVDGDFRESSNRISYRASSGRHNPDTDRLWPLGPDQDMVHRDSSEQSPADPDNQTPYTEPNNIQPIKFSLVKRDSQQLKPNISAAAEACRLLMESMSLVAKAQMGLAQALSALSDVDDGSVEKMAYRATHIGAERSVSILKGITRAFETNFFDTFRFLSVDTMAASSDVVSEIIRIPLQYNASQSRPHLHLVREWSVFRNIRHDLTLVSMWQLANKFSREHNRISRHWSIAVDEISDLNVQSPFSESVLSEWRGLVKREVGEMADTVSSLNQIHHRRKEMQQQFIVSSTFLAKEKGSRISPPSTDDQLIHKELSRPVIPIGVRHGPSEAMSSQKSVIFEDIYTETTGEADLTKSVPIRPDSTHPNQSDSRKKKIWSNYFMSSQPHEISPNNSIEPALPEEYVEDTPMNRAYMARQQRDQVKTEEEEEDSGPQKTREMEKKTSRRRPPPSTATQRRPRSMVKPAISSLEPPIVPITRPLTRDRPSQDFSPPAPVPASIPITSPGQTQGQPPYERNEKKVFAMAKPHESAEERNSVLPDGWEEVRTEDGGRYYYHRVTRLSRWEKPTAEVAAAVENRINTSQKQIEEALERNKRDRERKRLEEEHSRETADLLQTRVKREIRHWRALESPTGRKDKTLPEMLGSLSELVGSDICPLHALPLSISTSVNPAEVKKAYLKAVRYIHPDKISGSADIYQRVLAEEAFICLSQCYEMYRKSHGL